MNGSEDAAGKFGATPLSNVLTADAHGSMSIVEGRKKK
jgi:hypothetical protein